MKKTAIFILWKLSVMIGVLVIIYLAGIKAIQWLHTENGQKFVTARIAAQLKDSSVRFKQLKYTYHANGTYDVRVKGFIQSFPFTASARLKPRRYNIDIDNIKANLPELNVKGAISYKYGLSYASGMLQGTLNSLAPYQKGHDLDPLSFSVKLQPVNKILITAASERYSNKDAQVTLKDIAFNGEFQNNVLTINSLSLRDDKEGTVSADGTFNTMSQSADIKGTIRNFAPSVPYTTGKVNADITLTGTPETYLLKGTLNPQKMTITLPDHFATSVSQVNIVEKGKKPAPDFAKTLALDLIMNAPRQINVLGMGLDAEFGGILKIDGFADDPQVKGDLKIIRGRFSEFGKTFKITKATLEFFGSIPPSPELDIITETQAGEILAKILIAGSAQKPKISFSSIPEKPEDEVVSYILFGKDPSDLSPIQAIQLARSVAKFSGVVKGGGPDPIVALRNATGLDDISVETDEEGNVNVGAKKRINDRVTIEVESGSEPGSAGAKVEIELTPSITLESKVGQDASGGAGIFWKRDY